MSETFKVDSLIEFDDKQSAENMTELMDIDYYRIDKCDSGKYKIIPCTEWNDCQFIPIAIGDIVYHYFYGKVRIVSIERSNICNDVDIVVSKKGKKITIKNEKYIDFHNDYRMIIGISLERMRIKEFFNCLVGVGVGLGLDDTRESKERCTTYLLWRLALVLGLTLSLVLPIMTEIILIVGTDTYSACRALIIISNIVSVLLAAFCFYTIYG